jgi:hypothetical protein
MNILKDPGASIFSMKLWETMLSTYKPCVATAALDGPTLFEVCLMPPNFSLFIVTLKGNAI